MSKSNRASTRTASRRSGRGNGAVETFHRPGAGMVRGLLGLLIRMRAEILIITVLAVSWHYLHTHLSTVQAYVVLNGVPVAVLLWPASRRFCLRRLWCVIARHRMRACVVQIRSMMNFSGWMPWFLWSRPTPVGERIFLWLRPGISIEDLQDRTEHIAVACWARDARVRRSRRLAAFVIVDILRRDPLTGRKSGIDSPLTTVGAHGPTPPPVAVSMGTRDHLRPVTTSDATHTAESPATEPDKPTRQRKTTTKTSTDAVLLNGEDISDYV